MPWRIGSAAIKLVQGDITDSSSDVIVNAANSSLMGGGGVDGAIHRRGGPAILEECTKIRETQWRDGLPPGKAVITSGGLLRAKYVIHTVGPVWRGGRSSEPELLANCYRNSLTIALSKGLSTIAFPSISTGAFGYPISQASRVALSTVKDFLHKRDELKEVSFILFSHEDLEVYERTAAAVFDKQVPN